MLCEKILIDGVGLAGYVNKGVLRVCYDGCVNKGACECMCINLHGVQFCHQLPLPCGRCHRRLLGRELDREWYGDRVIGELIRGG